MNEVIGHLYCPLCAVVGRKTQATVHREARGKHALYYRCQECGTIQPRLQGGQAVMMKLLRSTSPSPEPMDSGPETDEPAKHVNDRPYGAIPCSP